MDLRMLSSLAAQGVPPSASVGGTNKVTHQFSSITSCFPKCSTYPTWCCWSLGNPLLDSATPSRLQLQGGQCPTRHLLWLPRALPSQLLPLLLPVTRPS